MSIIEDNHDDNYVMTMGVHDKEQDLPGDAFGITHVPFTVATSLNNDSTFIIPSHSLADYTQCHSLEILSLTCRLYLIPHIIPHCSLNQTHLGKLGLDVLIKHI